MLGADRLGPRLHTITLRDSHPVPLPRERQAHYGMESGDKLELSSDYGHMLEPVRPPRGGAGKHGRSIPTADSPHAQTHERGLAQLLL